MKKLLIIGLILMSTLTFAKDELRVNSGSISMSYGDGHRSGADAVLVLKLGEDRHHYEKRNVYRYREPKCVSKPKYRGPEKVVVIHEYHEYMGRAHEIPYGHRKKFHNNKRWHHDNYRNERYSDRHEHRRY